MTGRSFFRFGWNNNLDSRMKWLEAYICAVVSLILLPLQATLSVIWIVGTKLGYYRKLPKAWVAQTVEHQTFNLRVQGSSPCSGVCLLFAGEDCNYSFLKVHCWQQTKVFGPWRWRKHFHLCCIPTVPNNTHLVPRTSTSNNGSSVNSCVAKSWKSLTLWMQWFWLLTNSYSLFQAVGCNGSAFDKHLHLISSRGLLEHRSNLGRSKGQIHLENAGIDPAASRMLSKHSTIWANSPDAYHSWQQNKQAPSCPKYVL